MRGPQSGIRTIVTMFAGAEFHPHAELRPAMWKFTNPMVFQYNAN
jgi:hypothetical protein